MCGHGERAMTAATVLIRAGHHRVSVLDGGAKAVTLENKHHPSETRSLRP
jgi:rhodanese-related sulfurtransferase